MMIRKAQDYMEVYHDIRNCLLGAYGNMVGVWPMDNMAQL